MAFRSFGRQCLAAAWVTAAGFIGAAVAGVPFEKTLPEDCVAFVNVRDVAGLKSKSAETKMIQMWHDPAMKPFVDGVNVEFKKLLAELKSKSNVDVGEIAGYLSGQVVVALQMPKTIGPDSPPAVFILANVAGHEDAVKRTLEGFFAEGEKKGAVIRTMGDFTAIGPKDAKARKVLAYKITEGTLVMGNDTDLLGVVAKQLASGASSAFSDNSRFKAFRAKVGGEGDVELFVDLNKIIALAMTQAKGPQAAQMKKLGVESLQAAGISVAMGKDDFEVTQQIVLMKSGSSELFNLFNMPVKSMKPESWVPATCQSYFSFNWDVDLLYQTISKLVGENVPGGMETVNKQLAGPDPDNPLVNLKKDIFDALGNRLTMVSESAEEKGLPVSKSVMVWEMRNGDRFAALIEKLMGMAGGALPIQNKTVKGIKIYTFNAGEMIAAQNPNPDAPVPVGTIGFGVSKSQMYFATHVEVLDKVLQSDGASGLAESPAFRRVASKFPGQASLISFTGSEASMQSVWSMIKSGTIAKAADQMGNDDDAKPFANFLKAIDGKKLPEFEKIKKYLTPAGGYGIMDDAGLHLNFFSLKQ